MSSILSRPQSVNLLEWYLFSLKHWVCYHIDITKPLLVVIFSVPWLWLVLTLMCGSHMQLSRVTEKWSREIGPIATTLIALDEIFRGQFTSHQLTLMAEGLPWGGLVCRMYVSRAWISNYMRCLLWYVNTYPCPVKMNAWGLEVV